MIQINQLKLSIQHDSKALYKKCADLLSIKETEILRLHIIRRSVDARKKPDIYYIYCIQLQVRQEEKIYKNAKRRDKKDQLSLVKEMLYSYPSFREVGKKTVVVGAGPGGLFCAYFLALAGQKPILIERGYSVEKRREAVEQYWKTGVLDVQSNVQFGEGGAGTFSDGKLNTLVKDKSGRNKAVLETFVRFGAKDTILYDAKPHIGTDVLSIVIRNMRNEIIRLGGEVRFETQMTDLLFGGTDENGLPKISGIVVNHSEEIACDYLVMAIGHSARDTFEMLYHHKAFMEPKAFAVGFRVEHPQEMINESQYALKSSKQLGAAPYKVTAKAKNGRGVYSFCMCPGGYVVNASSEEGRLAVNGMSYSGRDGKNANSAIIVAVTPEDYPSEHPLSGIAFQRELEERAFLAGNGKIPVQRYGSFQNRVKMNQKAEDFENQQAFLPSAKGAYVWTDLTGILPKALNEAFIDGMEEFGKQIKGFDRPDVILSGVESRTSSPVRIVRDESLQSVSFAGLFPCGEGAGYAGGITSAAMDGIRIAEEILKRDLPK